MRRALRCLVLTAALLGGDALADDRLAVFEFIARQSTYCIAGAPTVIQLQEELAGRAVLLEYDFDAGSTLGRYQCYRAADPYGAYLPLTMVGSGLRTASGPVSYATVYRGMIDEELDRAPEAAVTAYWQRRGDALRVYVRAENRSNATLTSASGAAIWLIVWENARIRLTDTYVRSVVKTPITVALPPGGTVTATMDTPTLTGVSWDKLESLAMLERRTSSTGRYDMLQAAIAAPAGLGVSPPQLALGPSVPSAEVGLAGPHAMSWTADTDGPWLAVVPPSGTLPATVQVNLIGASLPPGTTTGEVRFTATGDGMTFAATVEVTVEGRRGTIRRRLHRVEQAAAPLRAP